MDSLLATKFRVPPQPHYIVHRARLINRIEQSIPHYKLILLSAPAGYGKTTSLAQWARASSFPVAWLSLSAQEDTTVRFFRYLLAAWEEVQPGVKESPLGLLLTGMVPDIEPDSEAVMSAFIELASDVPGHTAFVLDDYHLVKDPSLNQTLTFLLDNLPPGTHFVLAGRGEPPLPLARYRARRELMEFSAEDLRFLQEETADFLNKVMGLDLPPDEVAKLQTQLEGWVAGLQLSALSFQRRPLGMDKPVLDRGTALAVSGRHRFIADYLSEDVLAHLPQRTRQFLLQTSILDELCGPLCDAVTNSEGSQEMLERLERQNLFLVRLDDNREWFRYHHLFADYLLGDLKRRHPDMADDLHRKAARWYMAHELPDQAVNHAVEASDADLAVQILDRYIALKLNTGELRVVKRWLETLPQEWHAAYPIVGLAQAGLFAFTGELEACMRCMDEVERRLLPAESEQARRQLARVSAVRCAVACELGDIEQAETYAERALRDLTPEDDPYPHMVYGALGDVYRRNGRWEEARQSYLKVLEPPYSPTLRLFSIHVFGALADLELRQGRLRDAATYWSKALPGMQAPANWGRFPLPLIGWVEIRMAEILYEWNQLEEVGDLVSRGLQRAELGGDVRAMISGYLLAGRLKLTEGDITGAGEYLERSRPLMESAQFPGWTSRFERLQLDLWLAQNRLRTAVKWADDALRDGGFEERPETEDAQLAVAQVLTVKGDAPSLERAFAILSPLLRKADSESRAGIAIEVLALQAIAHWRHGDQASALTSLERALRMAEPESYVRLFADLGLPMVRLLQEARSRNVMPDYVGKLLASFGGNLPVSDFTREALPEPLSPREQEVLGLVAAGLTNKEIAERLVISSETVKKHISNICTKLNVGNRTEALARAREVDLLG